MSQKVGIDPGLAVLPALRFKALRGISVAIRLAMWRDRATCGSAAIAGE